MEKTFIVLNASRDLEVEEVGTSTLMTSVTQAFEKLKTQIPTVAPVNEHTYAEDR